MLFQRTSVKRVAALLAGLVLALMVWWPAVAQTPAGEPKKIRVEINDGGFDGQHELGLEVEQGQVVELTFVFDQQSALSDNHIVMLPGYGLETPELNYYNKEATLKFVANKPGSFDFKCDLDCDIHDRLQRGTLKVKAGAGGSAGGATAAAALAPTTLAFYPSAWEVNGESVKLAATLKDKSGAPVARAMVRFYADAEFVGTRGQMEIGAAKTDANGQASISYKPTLVGTQPIKARFEGMGMYAESEQAIQLHVRSAAPAYTVAPRGLELLRTIAPNLLVLVLAAIWSTFAFVLYQVFRIARPRRSVTEVRMAKKGVLMPASDGR